MTREMPFHADHRVGSARSDGPISGRLLADHVGLGAGLSFDPVQSGWVRADVIDDFHPATGRRYGWPSANGDLVLRKWTRADAAQYAALLDDPTVWAYMPQPYPGKITPDLATDLIALSNESAHHHVRAIVVGKTVVGQVRLEYSDEGSELSYWIGRGFWRKGFAGRAVRAFLSSAPVRGTLFARVRAENTASLRLLEGLGFQHQGRSNRHPDWLKLTHSAD